MAAAKSMWNSSASFPQSSVLRQRPVAAKSLLRSTIMSRYAAIVCVLPMLGCTFQADEKTTKKAADASHVLSIQEIQAKLAEPITLDKVVDTSIEDVLRHVTDETGLHFFFRHRMFEDDLQVKEIESQPISLNKLSHIPLGKVLDMLMDQINGACVVRRGFVEILPAIRVNPLAAARLFQSPVGESDLYIGSVPIDATIEGRSLKDTLKGFAEGTGINVVLDSRVGPRSDSLVTITLTKVPIGTAVRLVADMADLKVVNIGNVMFVTSKENATVLENEEEKRMKQRLEMSQFLCGPALPNAPQEVTAEQ
jgi:hypothetical protein